MKRLCSLLCAATAVLAQIEAQKPLSGNLEELTDPKLGAVASENKLCSQIGIDMLQAGGNAADAVSTLIRSQTSRCQSRLMICSQLAGTLFCVGVIGT